MTSQQTDTSTQDKLNTYWSIRSGPYDEFQIARDASGGYRGLWLELFVSTLPKPPLDILDVGTGSGYLAILLAELGHRVTATDLADGMLDRARQHAASMDNPPTFLRGDAVAPRFPDGGFDVITNRYLMWTLREPDTALAAWQRQLKPGGMIALVDSPWYKDGFDNTSNEHFSRYYDHDVRETLPLATATSIEPTQALVEQAGFHQVTLRPLHEILAKSSELGLEPLSGGQLQYLITAHS